MKQPIYDQELLRNVVGSVEKICDCEEKCFDLRILYDFSAAQFHSNSTALETNVTLSPVFNYFIVVVRQYINLDISPTVLKRNLCEKTVSHRENAPQ